MKLLNTVWVVTGAGNGLGREMTLLLLKKGAKVAAVDINEAALKETALLAKELEEQLSLIVGSVTDPSLIATLPARVEKTLGPVDGLINNAGIIQPFVKVLDLTEAQINKVMDINFYGVLRMTRTFLPYLLKRPEAYLVNVSSMGGFLPVPGQAIYGASKAAVKLMTEALQSELIGTSVHVTCVLPGGLSTNITQNSGVQTPKMQTANASNYKTTSPVKAAEIVIAAIEKNKRQVLVGGDAKFMNFLVRLNPKMAANMIAKALKL